MRLTVKIASDDAAATEDPRGSAANVLRDIIARLENWSEAEQGSWGFSIRDVNGNTIGSWGFANDEEDA